MQGGKSKLLIEIPPATQQIMQGLCRAQKTPLGVARRVQGMLLLAKGSTFVAAAKEAGLAERHLRKWAKRFKQDGLAGLYDKGRPGRPARFSP